MRLTAMLKRRVLLFVFLILLTGMGCALHLGFLNWGQPFGTYGQYNRVLHVIREMDRYQVIHSRLSRRLDWRNLGHLDRFSVKIRDPQGRISSVEFVHGSAEMRERDREALERIITAQLEAPSDSR
jgi:hypothetical protein